MADSTKPAPADVPGRSNLADLLDLIVQLDHDRGMSEGARRQRDRHIGQPLAPLVDQPVAQARGWLKAVREQTESPPTSIAPWLHGIWALLIALGALIGVAVAAGVFYYDGSRPVNVIHVLGVFVALQAVVLVLTVIAALPTRWTRWLPGAASFQMALWLISPGRLGPMMLRRLPAPVREPVSQWLGRPGADRQTHRAVQQWTVLSWSQSVAVAFNVSALLTALALITFSDLAFGWSTTLQIDAATLASVVRRLAAPWAWAWPTAVPTTELVEASRYYRLGDGTIIGDGSGAAAPAQLGEWWPFLIMSMAVYGLLPRVVLLALALHRRQHAVAEAIRLDPMVQRLLRRMNESIVTSQEQADDQTSPAAKVNTDEPAARWPRVDGPIAAIDWNAVPIAWDVFDEFVRRRFEASSAAQLEAGGARSIEADTATIEQIRTFNDGPALIIMLVRAWEPPMGEVCDFLTQLRTAIAHDCPIVVLPLGSEKTDDRSFPAPLPANLRQWRQRLAKLGDRSLSVMDPTHA